MRSSRHRHALHQAPLFISFFFATRRLATDNPEVAAESMFWLESLAEPDPYCVLPMITCCSLLCLAELGGDPAAGGAQQEQMAKMKNVRRPAPFPSPFRGRRRRRSCAGWRCWCCR